MIVPSSKSGVTGSNVEKRLNVWSELFLELWFAWVCLMLVYLLRPWSKLKCHEERSMCMHASFSSRQSCSLAWTYSSCYLKMESGDTSTKQSLVRPLGCIVFSHMKNDTIINENFALEKARWKGTSSKQKKQNQISLEPFLFFLAVFTGQVACLQLLRKLWWDFFFKFTGINLH